MAEGIQFSVSLNDLVSDSAHKAEEALKSLGVELPGLAKGLLAVAASMVAVGAAGLDLALDVTSTRARLEATFDALGKGPEAGKRTLDMLGEMSRVLPQSKKELAEWTREIEKAGVTDLGDVRRELLATASAQAVLGEEGPAAFLKIERKIHDAVEGHHALKIASKELTRTIGTNLAGAAAERMGLSLEQLEVRLKAGTIDAKKFGEALEDTFIAKGAKGLNALWASKAWEKIKEAGRGLFSGIDTGPVTDALRNFLGILDETQPSAQAMKAALTEAFDGIARGIGAAINEAEVAFLEFEVAALQVELALIPLSAALGPLGAALEQLVGPLDAAGAGTVTWKSTLEEITGIAHAATEAIRALTSAIDAYNKGTYAINAKQRLGMISAEEGAHQRAATGAPLSGGDSVLLAEEANRRKDERAAAARMTGQAIGDGLVNGMDGMVPAVNAAGQRLAETAVKGTKDGAGVKSPSKPATEIGGYVAEGLGLGMVSSPIPARAGRQLSTNALGGMVGSALAGAPANENGGAGVTISGLVIHITAPHGVTDATMLSATGLAVAVERLQLASGR